MHIPALALYLSFLLGQTTGKGVLTLNGTDVPMTHSSAFMKDGKGEYADEKMPLEVLISDREVAADVAHRIFGPAELAKDGKLVGVSIKLNPKNAKEMVLYLYVKPRKPGAGPMSISLNNSETHKLLNFTISPDRVKGRLVSSKEDKGPGADTNTEDKPDTFRFDLSFDAPIRKPPAITALLTGKAAQSVPPVATVVKLRAAFKRGDMEGALKMVSPSSRAQFDEMVKTMGMVEMKRQMTAYWKTEPANDVWLKRIIKVVIRGNMAVVIAKADGGSESHTLRKVGAEWKLVDG